MKERNRTVKDFAIMVVVMAGCCMIGKVIDDAFYSNSLVPSVFMLGVFLTSVLTKGYLCGISASILSVLMVNFFFIRPLYTLNFLAPENLLSALIMIIMTLITGTITSKLKRQEAIKAEGENERARADLFRAVSHDLRTPLTTIYGSSSALLESNNDFTPEQRYKILQNIQKDAQWLFRMVENLLSITRLDSGNVKIIKIPILIDELVDAVILEFHKRYPEQKVEINIPDDFVAVPMDGILIEQVLINILDNAVQHAEGMDMLSLKVYIKGDKAIFEIKDNGAGIAKDRLKNNFNGYYNQAEVSADCKRSNVGIGLSVCSTIIKAHGGEIKAENIKGGGAMFRFTLDMGDNNA